jgi:hypothetical protein
MSRDRFHKSSLSPFLILIVSAFLLVLPSVAYAHGEALYSAAWTLMGIYQFVCLAWMVSWKGLQGRRFVACLAYAIILGLLWWAVLYGFQAEPKFHPALESELRKIEPGIAERLGNQHRSFEAVFGSEYAEVLHFMFIFGVPILLPPLLAWGLYRFLKK